MTFVPPVVPHSAMAHELQRLVRGEVRFDRYSRALYSSDASIHAMEPVGVVIPRDVEDVAAVVGFCARHGVPLLPRGGGTSLAGQAVGEAIHVDFSRHVNRLLEVNSEERWARVEPGLVLDDLNAQLDPHGLMFGPDVAPSNRATLGGMIGNNSCGTRSIVHGRTSDHLLEARVLLSDGSRAVFAPTDVARWSDMERGEGALARIHRGVREAVEAAADEIPRRYPRIPRRVSGYNLDLLLDADARNLCALLAGSEGTLAVVEEAKIRLVPCPGHRGLVLLRFRDLDEALEANQVVLTHHPSAVELLDRMLLAMARESPEYRQALWFVDGEPSDMLLVELSGDQQVDVDARARALVEDLVGRRLGDRGRIVHDEPRKADAWKVRKAGLPLLMARPGWRKPVAFVEDAAVAPERLCEFAGRLRDIVRSHGTEAAFYAHASVACLHVRPLLDLRDARDVATMKQIAEEVCALVLDMGGALSGEHGDGLSRSMYNERMFGPVVYDAFRLVKAAFDPCRIMNPGKIVDAPELADNLRWREDWPAVQVEPRLDYSDQGSFEAAVELCNGSAVCRKTGTGTMCPSFMVTRDEEQSTRGRANALRAILSGFLPPGAFAEPRMREIFDLCISCKSCKSECPSGVDMARLKLEVMSRWYERHPLPLRSRLFSEAAFLGLLGSATAPVSNTLMGLPPVRWMLDRVLGIDGRRRLPEFAPTRFSREVARILPEVVITADSFRRPRPGGGREDSSLAACRTVVLLSDTFTEYHHPVIGLASLRVLQATGTRVRVAPPACCGRPAISMGHLRRAREQARILLEMLILFVDQGCDVVGCEPSCVAAIRDDYAWFLPRDLVTPVARRTFILEEYLLRLAEAGELPPGLFRPLEARVLLHEHCQQKSIMGPSVTARALRLVPGLDVEVVDSGCCGMAGAFGYQKEHYDVSLAMGERRLLPRVRKRTPGTLVVASGTSCRQQIRDRTGARALHPAQVLARALLVP